MSQSHPVNPQLKGRALALKRAMRLTLETQGIAQKAVAIDLGVDEGTLSRYLSPEHIHTLPICQLKAWYLATGDLSLLRTLAADHGCELVHEAPATVAPAEIQSLTVLLSRQAGSTLAQLIQALDDGVVTDAERAELRPELAKLLHTVQGLADQVGRFQ